MFHFLLWMYIVLSVVLLARDAVRDWKQSVLFACCDFNSPRGAIYLIIMVLSYPAIHAWVYITGFIRNRRNRGHA